MPVTIHDVAKRAQVSPSTVSRALSASHLVRGTTREHANEPVTALPRTRPAPPFAPAKDEPTPTQATLPDYGV